MKSSISQITFFNIDPPEVTFILPKSLKRVFFVSWNVCEHRCKLWSTAGYRLSLFRRKGTISQILNFAVQARMFADVLEL